MNYALSTLPASERALGMLAVLLVHLVAGLWLVISLARPVIQQMLVQPLRIDLVAPAPVGQPDLPLEAPRPLPVQRELPPRKPAAVPTPPAPPVIQAPPVPVAQEAPMFTAAPAPVEPVAVAPEGSEAGGAPGVAEGGAGDGVHGAGESGNTEEGARYDVDYLSNPKPQYPMASRKMGEEGTVLLRVQVSEAGRPLQVLIDQSSGYARLDRAARETVANSWRFVPGRRGDQAITSWVLVPIEFSLGR